MCQSLVLSYGTLHSQTLGPSYDGFLTTVASCLLTASILLACYLLSAKSIGLLRSSLFVSTGLGCVRYVPADGRAYSVRDVSIAAYAFCLVRQSAVAIAVPGIRSWPYRRNNIA